MKTEELVNALSNNTEPVDRGLVGRMVGIALGAGVTVAFEAHRRLLNARPFWKS
ncbi:hypothetical protein [Nitrobacter hamburgensis]|uniref:hypothetical protein n=1 Tax=Nitrobacter hamburgensis TaxID=912 RepID=UPI00031EA50A|nr:hypothetical protein [Nitrobacter hamburgensis]